MRRYFGWTAVLAGLSVAAAEAQRAPIATVARDPYAGAIVVNAADGAVLFEDRADVPAYPASMLKLMDALLVLERVEKGTLRLQDPVAVTAEAAGIGGSQVYLAEKEQFPVDEMLYALMIQSANDAATALAIHVAGSKDGFVQMMNARARQLGMNATEFNSVHGLPPATGQKPDVTTARDFARLCVNLTKRKDIFQYTSVAERGFRNGTFIMRTHNGLLGTFPGCDGLKTGYYRAAGYSIAATAQKDGARVIAVVLGSATKAARDLKARELLSLGLASVARTPVPPAPAPAPAPAVVTNLAAKPPPPAAEGKGGRGRALWIGGGAAIVLVAMILGYRRQQWGR
jgi:D-alanyl-D-alanine carboxypeptidase (penicillin-binding protein 5/6)